MTHDEGYVLPYTHTAFVSKAYDNLRLKEVKVNYNLASSTYSKTLFTLIEKHSK